MSIEDHMQILESEYIALTNLLHDWARWQSRYSPNIGYGSRSAGFGSGGLSSFEDMCEQSDSVTMRTLDAAIDSLLPAQRAAINRCYGVCAVFRFPRENYEATLAMAHESLSVSVKRRGVMLC